MTSHFSLPTESNCYALISIFGKIQVVTADDLQSFREGLATATHDNEPGDLAQRVTVNPRRAVPHSGGSKGQEQ